ncbi:bifunctional hydroxymethylpyrimidine kinase/phosphomethylpyrimidine kinase, partial [Actinocorallia lasiicapitis]
MRAGPPTICLSIGTSDSSGGAGVQGDVKTCAALGAYCATVVVGITAQNTRGVRAHADVPLRMLDEQLSAVLDDLRVDAVKVGTVWSADVMRLLADRLGGLSVPIVFDPVLGTAAGGAIPADRTAVEAAAEGLLGLATVATPNLAEARILCGAPGENDPAVLAEQIVARGARAVLLTDVFSGGDWLFDGELHRFLPAAVRHTTGCEHGAGCAHSTVLAVLLARGFPLRDAAVHAHRLAAASVAR